MAPAAGGAGAAWPARRALARRAMYRSETARPRATATLTAHMCASRGVRSICVCMPGYSMSVLGVSECTGPQIGCLPLGRVSQPASHASGRTTGVTRVRTGGRPSVWAAFPAKSAFHTWAQCAGCTVADVTEDGCGIPLHMLHSSARGRVSYRGFFAGFFRAAHCGCGRALGCSQPAP